MAKKTIYVLHKNGANSHYSGLKYLLEQEDINLKFREFSVFSKFFKSLKTLNFNLFKKQCINLGFLIKLLYSKNQKVVLGIAPFDHKLIRLLRVLKSHQIYYHTSWTCWDGTFQPKSKKNSPKVKKAWRDFLESNTKHIFCVSNTSKNEILKNYEFNANKISEVYHAVDAAFFDNSKTLIKEKLSFIYVGRLVKEKGIEELLDYFSKEKKSKLSILGSGKLENSVQMYSNKHKNISFYSYTNDKSKIAELISNHEYFVLNSKKSKKWEELFGLALIESMAQGTVPVSSNHTGPKEVVGTENGYLFNEGNLKTTLDNIIGQEKSIEELSQLVKKNAEFYKVENISKFWKPILN